MKNLTYLTLFISFQFLSSSFAEDCINCHIHTPEAPIENKLLPPLPGGIHCPNADELLSNEINASYKSIASKAVTSRIIDGKQFKGYLDELNYLASSLGPHSPKSWAMAKKSCETALCALKTMVGSEENAKMLVLVKKNSGYTIKLDQSEGKTADGWVEQMWSTSEIKLFYKVSQELPAPLRSLNGINGFWRIPSGYSNPNARDAAAYSTPNIVIGGKVWREGKIVALDGAFDASKYHDNDHGFDEHAFVHEICHHKDFQNIYHSPNATMLSEAPGSSFGALSGWRKVAKAGETTWTYKAKADGKGFVSEYAETQPAEDYAETCSDYVLSPLSLKRDAPGKYEWMKNNVFHGEEYVNAKWNTPANKVTPWPELEKTLTNHSECSDTIKNCLTGVTYEKGAYHWSQLESSTANSSLHSLHTQNPSEFFSGNTCWTHARKKWTDTKIAELSQDQQYCEKGGAPRIQSASTQWCSEDWTAINNLITQFDQKILDEEAKKCAQNKKDLSTQCMMAGYFNAKGVNSEMASTLRNVIPGGSQKAQVIQAIQSTSPTVVLKSCIGTQTYAMIPKGDNGETWVYYGANANSSNLAPLESQKEWDINTQTTHCLNGVLKNLKAQGYSGTDDIQLQSMRTLFDESGIATTVKSFNQMLISARTKSYDCAIKFMSDKKQKQCNSDALSTSITAWAQGDSEKLALIHDQELFEKLKSWTQW